MTINAVEGKLNQPPHCLKLKNSNSNHNLRIYTMYHVHFYIEQQNVKNADSKYNSYCACRLNTTLQRTE